MAPPFTFDVESERTQAAALLAIGVTQASLAASQANRGDASRGLVGLGDAGSPSQNPMQINGVLPSYVQPNPAPAITATAPPPAVGDPMKVGPHGNYIQPPDPPRPSSSGPTTVRNPMGL